MKFEKFHSIYTRSADPFFENKRGFEGVPAGSHGHKKLAVRLLLEFDRGDIYLRRYVLFLFLCFILAGWCTSLVWLALLGIVGVSSLGG